MGLGEHIIPALFLQYGIYKYVYSLFVYLIYIYYICRSN